MGRRVVAWRSSFPSLQAWKHAANGSDLHLEKVVENVQPPITPICQPQALLMLPQLMAAIPGPQGHLTWGFLSSQPFCFRGPSLSDRFVNLCTSDSNPVITGTLGSADS